MKKLLIYLFILVGINGFAQDEEINVAGLVFLNYQGNLPDGITSNKSVVLISSPNRPGESIAEDWHPLAEEVHPVLVKGGADPVAYYFYDDVYAGLESRAAFAKSWKKRGIGNIIILIKSEVNNKKGDMRYLLLITAFNGKSGLMTGGQNAWKATNKNFKNVLQKYSKASNKLEKKNLMPNDAPEYFDDVRIITGSRVESYYTDLHVGKLAVPMFASGSIPGKRPGGLVNNLVGNRREQAEEQSKKYNAELARIMNTYKFEFGLVDSESSDEELMQQGYAYSLRRLHTSGIEIKRLLNYEIDEEDEFYITNKLINGKPTMRYIPPKAPVYKYYVKNLKTGNVYLGRNWDADETWQESLKNVIYNINKELKK